MDPKMLLDFVPLLMKTTTGKHKVNTTRVVEFLLMLAAVGGFFYAKMDSVEKSVHSLQSEIRVMSARIDNLADKK